MRVIVQHPHVTNLVSVEIFHNEWTWRLECASNNPWVTIWFLVSLAIIDPVAERRVRQAINHGWDRRALPPGVLELSVTLQPPWTNERGSQGPKRTVTVKWTYFLWISVSNGKRSPLRTGNMIWTRMAGRKKNLGKCKGGSWVERTNAGKLSPQSGRQKILHDMGTCVS